MKQIIKQFYGRFPQYNVADSIEAWLKDNPGFALAAVCPVPGTMAGVLCVFEGQAKSGYKSLHERACATETAASTPSERPTIADSCRD